MNGFWSGFIDVVQWRKERMIFIVIKCSTSQENTFVTYNCFFLLLADILFSTLKKMKSLHYVNKCFRSIFHVYFRAVQKLIVID